MARRRVSYNYFGLCTAFADRSAYQPTHIDAKTLLARLKELAAKEKVEIAVARGGPYS